jgi:hypothetical protein
VFAAAAVVRIGRLFTAIGRFAIGHWTLAWLAIGSLLLAGTYLKDNQNNNAESYEK